MQALSAIWARMGLTTRLNFALGLATCLALMVAIFLSADLASQQAKKQLDTDLQERLADLSRAISAAPAQQNIEGLLNQQVLLPGISAAGYRSAQDATALEKQAPEIQTAPAWFLRLCAIRERQGVQPIMVNGRLMGQVALTMSPIPAVNAAWDFLIQQFCILMAGGSIVFVGVWWALRANLKPFNALVERSRALGRGDFSQRLAIVGSREFRDTFTAFNVMSDNLENLVDKLTSSEQAFSTLVEAAPVGVIRIDRDGKTVFANSTIRQISGMSEGGATSDAWLSRVHPDDQDKVREYRTKMRTQIRTQIPQGDIPDGFMHRYLRPDGSVIWLQVRVASLRDREGNPADVVVIVNDITAEHELRQRSERLSQLYATLSKINSIIVQVPDDETLYAEVCRAIVDVGKFEQAMITLVDWDHRRLRHAFSFGVMPSSSEFAERDIDDKKLQSIDNLAMLEDRGVNANDFVNDDRLSPYVREFAKRSIVRSAATVPIRRAGRVVGSVSIVSSEVEFFTEDILELIDEIGRDVSHALENIDRERQRRQAEEVLKQNEEQLRLAVSSAKLGTFVLDFVKMESRLDATCARYHNLGDNPIVITLEAFLVTLPEDVKVNAARQVDAIVRGEQDSYSLIAALPLADGSLRWLHNFGTVTAERTADGGLVIMHGVTLDITATKSLEDRDHLAATVFNHSGEAIVMGNTRREVILVNEAFTRITGFSESEALNKSTNSLYRSDRHDEAFYADIHDIVKREGVWRGEIWRKRKNGEVYPALTAVSVVRGKNGEITHFVEQQTDISKQKEFETRISELAYRDALTGLPNRTLLRDRVEQNIALAHREGSTLALLFLDLDHFKNINDSLGHSVGDRLLNEIAQRLTSTVRDMDTVGRLGGDEFLILLPDANAEAAAHVAQKLLIESARPLVFESHSLVVTPSVGIALYPKDGATFDELLTTADTAMYRAKDEGRNAYRFYTPEMNQAVFQRMVLESSLRRAIEKNEFVLHYQPKFELKTQTLVGVEALIRWHQPEMGMISPAQFIPVAEESGLIEAIGKWVLEKACRQIKAWLDEGLPLLRVAVNFSARQFAARNITELVISTLEKIGVSGNGLEMEITESLLAQDMDYTLEVFKSLKKRGVHIAVDDFGTGYSSLSYLKRFPIDRLKIDQSFVRDLVKDPDDRAIATAIVTLGHSLGIRVIAEGVETVNQLNILREMGCDEVQGYYLGRPIPAAEMTIALRKFAADRLLKPVTKLGH